VIDGIVENRIDLLESFLDLFVKIWLEIESGRPLKGAAPAKELGDSLDVSSAMYTR
jgi:hypothetical protein